MYFGAGLQVNLTKSSIMKVWINYTSIPRFGIFDISDI